MLIFPHFNSVFVALSIPPMWQRTRYDNDVTAPLFTFDASLLQWKRELWSLLPCRRHCGLSRLLSNLRENVLLYGPPATGMKGSAGVHSCRDRFYFRRELKIFFLTFFCLAFNSEL